MEEKLFLEALAIVNSSARLPDTAHDEVLPGIFLSEASTAKNKHLLGEMGITHIINCCEGVARTQVATGPVYYEQPMSYFGIPGMDIATFDMSIHFEATHKFIKDGLASGGRVLVHCKEGISRSATVVIAHLMQTGVPVVEAVRHVKQRRRIFPNDGFLRQLVAFELTLRPVSTPTGAAVPVSESV
eukprot:m.21460 g.21460  ORF g.21460 m.21460 type:complete len:186 (+) comp8086_c0_seq1:109-666(+)